jgi:ribosome assembly protein RRB1
VTIAGPTAVTILPVTRVHSHTITSPSDDCFFGCAPVCYWSDARRLQFQQRTLQRAAMAPGSGKKAATPSSGSRSTKRKATADLNPDSVANELDTELVFEDPYGDDYETDEETVAAEAAAGRPPPITSPVGTQPMLTGNKMVFRPGIDKLGDGETLICDETAYDLLHRLTPEWPALSFDFVCCDASSGYVTSGAIPQNTYPVSVMVVAGTQALTTSQNKLQVMKLTNMHRTRKQRGLRSKETKKVGNGKDDGDSDDDDHDDSENDVNSDTEDEEDEEAAANMADSVLQSVDIKFDCVINRVRTMPQRANVVAVWGESGRVLLVDILPALDSLNRDSFKRMPVATGSNAKTGSIKPFMSFSGHKDEGYGLDWSTVTPGRLLSGANNGGIYLWDMNGSGSGDGGWTVSSDRFRGHKGSVEDLQWSPNEKNVFASCGVDKSIRFWDTREYRKPALSIKGAHESDVNVISWNRNEAHLVVSGGDDGVIKVWDLRALDQKDDNSGAAAAAEFNHHKEPITSVEWHPRDASMLAASSEDGSVSIWDLAVERDPEEELREGVVLAGAEQYPPQLLFIHMGQKNTKEVHWHPSSNSVLASTAEDGFNVFKPANISLT